MTRITSIVPSLSFTFHEGIPGSKDCLYTQWPARSADLADTLDVWQKQSDQSDNLTPATPRNTLLPSVLLYNCSFRVAIHHHSGHASFYLARQNSVCKSIQLCGGGQSTIPDFTFSWWCKQ